MSKKYTKFKSNYVMHSLHQKTDLGTIMERDWATTNGLNVLRFGSGRKIWYNSGNFVFTTANTPTYHKKHKLTTEVKTWKWEDCQSADGTVNTIVPNFNTKDLRDYAYYGSCVELIRATVEDIISDFPGSLKTTLDYPITDWKRTGYRVDYSEKEPKYDLKEGYLSQRIVPNGNCGYDVEWYYYDGKKWNKAEEVKDEKSMTDSNKYYYVSSDEAIKKLNGNKIEDYDTIQTNRFTSYYTSDFKYYEYNYSSGNFKQVKSLPKGVVDGFVLENPFKIDMHHKGMVLDKYDNSMRFMENSWQNYCIINNNNEEEIFTSYTIESNDSSECGFCDEGKIIHTITIETGDDENKNKKKYTIYAYYIGGEIVYIYKDISLKEIRPKKDYINEYFANLTGFKRQLLRQDTKPLYNNKFITPVEYNLTLYYPEKTYIWPSDGYCIDVSSFAFETFISKLFDLGQKFDEIWSDNLYRSMTHESIKNFDWTYSREYYEGDAQDNIDGGERMQKIIRVYGRVFDDIKLYIDTLKISKNITYDRYRNGPEALLSDEIDIKGIDVKSTILHTSENTESDKTKSDKYGLNTNISDEFLINKGLKWYPTRKNEDIYPDVCDNEIMRRLSLSAKRIMQTKGTQHGIEMMMGLFGLGGDDYKIEETAYCTKGIKSDDCVTEHVGNTVDWTTVKSRTMGDLANEINYDKKLDLLYYSDPFSGVPLREVVLGRTKYVDDNKPYFTSYIVPYYDSTQLYDGDLIFQEKGGWGKTSDNEFSYQETVSYLQVVETVGDLLDINSNMVDNQSIFYVVNIGDYITYDENPPINENVTLSHYFICVDSINSHKFKSWQNIVVNTDLDKDGNIQNITENDFNGVFNGQTMPNIWDYKVYKHSFNKVTYLENIISTNIANNPHVGYGKYDDGNTFLEYMKLPFKYIIDNVNLINNSELARLAESIKFDFVEEKTTTDKIQIIDTKKDGWRNPVSDFIRYVVNDNRISETNSDFGNDEEYWYINTKLLTISLKNESLKKSNLFKQYFKSIIMPYVMQVIPSTTILKLIDFV